MKKILFFIIIVVCLLSVVRSVSSIISLWSKRTVLIQAQKELSLAQKQNKYLNGQLKVVEDSSFVEKEARDELFMVKPGENTVIISKDLLTSPTVKKTSPSQQLSNWQQWWELFF